MDSHVENKNILFTESIIEAIGACEVILMHLLFLKLRHFDHLDGYFCLFFNKKFRQKKITFWTQFLTTFQEKKIQGTKFQPC